MEKREELNTADFGSVPDSRTERSNIRRAKFRWLAAVILGGCLIVGGIVVGLLATSRNSSHRADDTTKATATATEKNAQPEPNVDFGLDANIDVAENKEPQVPLDIPQGAVADDDLEAMIEVDLDWTPNETPAKDEVPANARAIPFPEFECRLGAAKTKLLKSGGGSEQTEAAVARALEWLAKQQTESGRWDFDGSHKELRIAATGMALLPFLASGESHWKGEKYRKTVSKGLYYLKRNIRPNGQFGNTGAYEQAIATLAMCEAVGMTQDEELKKLAQSAVNFIVRAQAKNGSWGYNMWTDGDTSILGWQIQALWSAKSAGLTVPQETLRKADAFLIGVSDDSESRYGYRTKGSTHTLSAVGLLSRMRIADKSNAPWVARGVKNLWEEHKPSAEDWNVYYYHYATQVAYRFGGKRWSEDWNPALMKLLLEKQISAASAVKSEVGSWPKDSWFIGSSCGRLGTTSLACLVLEVYYRHAPQWAVK